MTETRENECQHCHQEVEWGQTEQGFKGFVHISTGLAACTEDK